MFSPSHVSGEATGSHLGASFVVNKQLNSDMRTVLTSQSPCTVGLSDTP